MTAERKSLFDALRRILKRSQVIDGDPVALSDALADIELEARRALDTNGEPRG